MKTMVETDELITMLQDRIKRLKADTEDMREWLDGLTDSQIEDEIVRLTEIADDANWRVECLETELNLRAIWNTANAIRPNPKP